MAIIERNDVSSDRGHLNIDIGSNRFYELVFGESSRRNRYGIRVINNPALRTGIKGPLEPESMGRAVVELPEQNEYGDARLLQLTSYARKERTGPAVSRIHRILPRPRDELPDRLPRLSEIRSLSDNASDDKFTAEDDTGQAMIQRNTTSNAFKYGESHMSETMFLSALTNMLPNILPSLGNILGGLFSGGSQQNASSTPSANPLSALSDPETIQQITQLINTLASGANPSTPSAAVTPAEAPAAVTEPSSDGATAAPDSQAASLVNPLSKLPYSQAQVAPALLAAIPALAPLLQQVLNPETLQTIVDAPSRHAGTLINGLKDMSRLGIESAEQDLRHLRELHNATADPALDALLSSMSLGISDLKYEVNYRRVPSVRVEFSDVQTTKLFGRTVVPYRFGKAIGLPMTVDTPRPIAKGVLDITVKCATTLKIRCRKRHRVENVQTGSLPIVPSLSVANLRRLKANNSYLICADLIWKNRKGEKRGTSIQQEILLLDEFAFDRVEESSQLIPFSDPEKFRTFWHRVWQGKFSREHKRYEVFLKYFYILKPGVERTSRLETVENLKTEDRRKKGNLKSGLEFSIEDLNRLLPTLSPQIQPLSEAELKALESSDFAERFNRVARYHGKMRGRPDDRAVLWVYPEVKLQTIVLKKAVAENGNGNIVTFEDHPVKFPMPALLHVIGARSE